MYGTRRRKRGDSSPSGKREQSLKDVVLATHVPWTGESLDEDQLRAACSLAYARLTTPLICDDEERERWRKYMQDLDVQFHILPNNSSPHEKACLSVKNAGNKVLAVFGVSVQTRKSKSQSTSRFSSPLSFLPHFSFRRRKGTDHHHHHHPSTTTGQDKARSREKKSGDFEEESSPPPQSPQSPQSPQPEEGYVSVEVSLYWLGYVGFQGGGKPGSSFTVQVRDMQRQLSWIADYYMQKMYKSFDWRSPPEQRQQQNTVSPLDMRRVTHLPTSSSGTSNASGTAITSTEGYPASTEEPSSGFSPHTTHCTLADFPSDRPIMEEEEEEKRQEEEDGKSKLAERWHWIEKCVESERVLPLGQADDYHTYSYSSELMEESTTDDDMNNTTTNTRSILSLANTESPCEESDSTTTTTTTNSTSTGTESSDYVMSPQQIMDKRIYTQRGGDPLFWTKQLGKGVDAVEGRQLCDEVYLFSVYTPPTGKISFLTLQQRVVDVIWALANLLYIPSIPSNPSDEDVEEWSTKVQEALIRIPSEGPDDVERDRTALHFLCRALAGCSYQAQVKFVHAVELMTDARLGRVTDARCQNYLSTTKVVIAALQQKLGFYLTDSIEKKRGIGWSCDQLTAEDLDQVGIAVGKHIITSLHLSKMKIEEWGVNWIEKVCSPSEYQLARNCLKWWERQCVLADKKLFGPASPRGKGKEEEEEEEVREVVNKGKKRQVRVLTFDTSREARE